MSILLKNIQIGDILIDSYGESFCIVIAKNITLSIDLFHARFGKDLEFDVDDTTYWNEFVDEIPGIE